MDSLTMSTVKAPRPRDSSYRILLQYGQVGTLEALVLLPFIVAQKSLAKVCMSEAMQGPERLRLEGDNYGRHAVGLVSLSQERHISTLDESGRLRRLPTSE